jgi:LAO/AO transport system kinase
VGVIAVDPSSALSGGAILGDRIRMAEHNGDAGVFIRSLASRGALGGVSRATVDAVAVLDAAGYEHVIIETVGVGQADVDVMRIADTIVVVSVPGSGDSIQLIKAGLVEVADVHVVNKADKPESDRLVAELRTMLHLSTTTDADRPSPPVIETVATTGLGIGELLGAISEHRVRVQASSTAGVLRRRTVAERIREIAKELFVERLELDDDVAFEAAVASVMERRQSPYLAARSLVAEVPVNSLQTEVHA